MSRSARVAPRMPRRYWNELKSAALRASRAWRPVEHGAGPGDIASKLLHGDSQLAAKSQLLSPAFDVALRLDVTDGATRKPSQDQGAIVSPCGDESATTRVRRSSDWSAELHEKALELPSPNTSHQHRRTLNSASSPRHAWRACPARAGRRTARGPSKSASQARSPVVSPRSPGRCRPCGCDHSCERRRNRASRTRRHREWSQVGHPATGH